MTIPWHELKKHQIEFCLVRNWKRLWHIDDSWDGDAWRTGSFTINDDIEIMCGLLGTKRVYALVIDGEVTLTHNAPESNAATLKMTTAARAFRQINELRALMAVHDS